MYMYVHMCVMWLYLFTVPGEVTEVSLNCQPAETYNDCTAMWDVSDDNFMYVHMCQLNPA